MSAEEAEWMKHTHIVLLLPPPPKIPYMSHVKLWNKREVSFPLPPPHFSNERYDECDFNGTREVYTHTHNNTTPHTTTTIFLT